MLFHQLISWVLASILTLTQTFILSDTILPVSGLLGQRNTTLTVRNLDYNDRGYYNCTAAIFVFGRTYSVQRTVRLTVQGKLNHGRREEKCLSEKSLKEER